MDGRSRAGRLPRAGQSVRAFPSPPPLLCCISPQVHICCTSSRRHCRCARPRDGRGASWGDIAAVSAVRMGTGVPHRRRDTGTQTEPEGRGDHHQAMDQVRPHAQMRSAWRRTPRARRGILLVPSFQCLATLSAPHPADVPTPGDARGAGGPVAAGDPNCGRQRDGYRIAK